MGKWLISIFIVALAVTIIIWVRENSRVSELKNQKFALLLIWSPHMPLSIDAFLEVREVASQFGMPLSVYLDSYANKEFAIATVERLHLPRYVLRQLDSAAYANLDAGAHSPALYLMSSGRTMGSPILGYNSKDQYIKSLTERLTAIRGRESEASSVLKKCDRESVETQTLKPLSHYSYGVFHQPLADGKILFFAADEASWSFNPDTAELNQGPSLLDPFPTPDKAMIVGLVGKDRRVSFYPTREWLTNSSAVRPIFEDPGFSNPTYQSLGLLSQNKSQSVYRMIVRTAKGVLFRDYVYEWLEGKVRAASEIRQACWNMSVDSQTFTLPMISKDGTRLFARDGLSEIFTIFQLHPDGQCTVEALLPFAQMGKAAFSYDGKRIAFHASPAPGSDHNDGFVYDWESDELWRIEARPHFTILYPSFTKDGDLIVLRQPHIEDQKSDVQPTFERVHLKRCKSETPGN